MLQKNRSLRKSTFMTQIMREITDMFTYFAMSCASDTSKVSIWLQMNHIQRWHTLTTLSTMKYCGAYGHCHSLQVNCKQFTLSSYYSVFCIAQHTYVCTLLHLLCNPHCTLELLLSSYHCLSTVLETAECHHWNAILGLPSPQHHCQHDVHNVYEVHYVYPLTNADTS